MWSGILSIVIGAALLSSSSTSYSTAMIPALSSPMSVSPALLDLSDFPISLPGQVVRLRLDRSELSPSYLTAQLTRKSYISGEHPVVKNDSPPEEILESFVSTPLTSIPKDYGYTALFSIGTNDVTSSIDEEYDGHGQLFNLLIDTGSDLVVIMSDECEDPECLLVPNRFNCSTSATCGPSNNLLTGGDRWVQRNQPILLVDEPGLHLFKSYGPAVDGIIGMNLGSPIISKTIIQNLHNNTVTTTSTTISDTSIVKSSLSAPVSDHPLYPLSADDLSIQEDSRLIGMGFMSLWLGHSLEPGQGGEMLLNAVDRTRFRGSIQWCRRGNPITSIANPYDWSVHLDEGILLYNTLNETMDPLLGSDNTFAVIDSGSDGIYLERSLYDALFQMIPGARQLPSGYWRVPCQGTTELCFGIEKNLYRIPYKDWVQEPRMTKTRGAGEELSGMCQSRVYGSSPGPILLGTTFLRTVYTVFDFSRTGYERVGFARLA
ncbi:hypothetical protein BGX28_009798 [Mortierella sp. GBA30]|nr:hypothetical protein BGX28_009798 [Mortierella sp. GBA30]